MTVSKQYYLIQCLYVFAVSFTKTSYVPFLKDTGLSLQDIHLLFAIFSVSVLLLEIPTSAMGEWLGAKKSFLMGCALKIISASLFFGTNLFHLLALSEVVSALAIACISGSLSTWLMNELNAKGVSDAESSQVFIVGDRLSKLTLLLGGVGGAYLASYDLRWPWIGVGIGFALTFLVSGFLFLFKPQVETSISYYRRKPKLDLMKTVKGYRVVFENKTLLLLVLQSFAFSVALASPKLMWIPSLKDIFNEDMVFLGHVWLTIALIQFCGTFGMPRMLRWVGSPLKLKFGFSLLTSAALAGLVLGQESMFLYIGCFFFIEMTKPYHQALEFSLFKRETPLEGRLTVLSFENLASKLGGSLGLVLASWTSGTSGIKWVWAVGLAFYLAVLPLYFFLLRTEEKEKETEKGFTAEVSAI